MDYMFWVWIGVIVAATIIELASFSLTSIWFTIGGIITLPFSLIKGMPWAAQISIFVVVSSLLLIFLRKISLKFLYKNKEEKTNIDNIIGQRVRMITNANFEALGSAKINDVVWSVKSEGDVPVEANEVVEIVKISGNKLIVRKIENADNTIKIENEEPEVKAIEENKENKGE